MRLVFSALSMQLVLFSFALTPSIADQVTFWQANGNALDSSGNSHDGALHGASYGAGRFGQGFLFDGVNDSVQVAADPALEPLDISVALWISASSSNGLQLVIDSNHGGSNIWDGWAMQVFANGTMDFAYGNGTTFPHVNSTTAITDGSFHHIVATFDGSSNTPMMSMYVDGVLEATAAFAGTPLPSGGEIWMGNHYAFSRPLNGVLDDVRIYNHVLSQSEVSRLANIPEPASAGVLMVAMLGCTLRRLRKN